MGRRRHGARTYSARVATLIDCRAYSQRSGLPSPSVSEQAPVSRELSSGPKGTCMRRARDCVVHHPALVDRPLEIHAHPRPLLVHHVLRDRDVTIRGSSRSPGRPPPRARGSRWGRRG